MPRRTSPTTAPGRRPTATSRRSAASGSGSSPSRRAIVARCRRPTTSRARSPSSRPTCPGLPGYMEPDAPGMHTTDTIDFEVVLEGEIWLELDDGVTVHLKAGDTVVQNGTRHAWRNHGTETCRLAVFICGAHHDQVPLATLGAGHRGSGSVTVRRHDGLASDPADRVQEAVMARSAPRPGVPRHRRDRGVRLDARVHDRADLPVPDRRARQPAARARRHRHGGGGVRVRDPDRASSPTAGRASGRWSSATPASASGC